MLLLMLLLALLCVGGCADLSCSPQPVGETEDVATGTESTGASASTTRPSTATTEPSTTTTNSTTTTSSTTTTLGPMDAYRAEMRAWRDEYSPRLSGSYTAISTMRDPMHPSATEIQAAADLDRVLSAMASELEGIKPPAHVSSTHAEYLASMEEMAEGAHDLSEAMKNGKAFRTVSAMTAFAVSWEKGEPARTALESTLGFSLSG